MSSFLAIKLDMQSREIQSGARPVRAGWSGFRKNQKANTAGQELKNQVKQKAGQLDFSDLGAKRVGAAQSGAQPDPAEPSQHFWRRGLVEDTMDPFGSIEGQTLKREGQSLWDTIEGTPRPEPSITLSLIQRGKKRDGRVTGPRSVSRFHRNFAADRQARQDCD